MKYFGAVIVENGTVVSDQETVEERNGRFFNIFSDGTILEVRRLTDDEYLKLATAQVYGQHLCWIAV
jgi:hypothetical protein